MKDYSDLDLNSQLRKVGGIAAEPRKYTSEYQFDATTDIGVVTAPKIQDGAVGSAALGTSSVGTVALVDLSVTTGKLAAAAVTLAKMGTAAVGSAQIIDAAIGSAAIGTAVIQSVHIGTAAVLNANIGTISANKITGGTMSANYLTAGTITTSLVNVVDGSGTTVIDSAGLIGNVSFISSISENTANQEIVGTGWANITKLGGTIITTRNTPVLFFTRAEHSVSSAGIDSYFRINVNSGAAIYPNPDNSAGWIQNIDTANAPYGFSISYLIAIPAGTNSVILQGRSSSASGTLTVSEYSHFGYVVLGK